MLKNTLSFVVRNGISSISHRSDSFPVLRSYVTNSSGHRSSRMSHNGSPIETSTPPSVLMSFAAFVKWRMGSKEEYVRRMKVAFPESTVAELEEDYIVMCLRRYKAFMEDGHFRDPGIMFSPEDFKEDNATIVDEESTLGA